MSHRPIIDAGPSRVTRQPIQARLRHPKDLGEIMVIAHAVVAAEAGDTVTVLIDDGSGARLATSEISRLRRLRTRDQAVGSIRLVSTLTVLERAAGGPHIADRGEMRALYQRLRGLDDGLPPMEATNLLAPVHWP